MFPRSCLCLSLSPLALLPPLLSHPLSSCSFVLLSCPLWHPSRSMFPGLCQILSQFVCSCISFIPLIVSCLVCIIFSFYVPCLVCEIVSSCASQVSPLSHDSLVCPCVYLCLQSPSYSAVCSVNWFSFLYSLVQFCFLQVWQKNCYCCFHIQSHNCKKVTTSISVSVIDICIHLFIYFQFWLEITLWSLWLPTTPKQ